MDNDPNHIYYYLSYYLLSYEHIYYLLRNNGIIANRVQLAKSSQLGDMIVDNNMVYILQENGTISAIMQE